MPRFEDAHNTYIEGLVTPGIRVFWSRSRAWHGEEVTIQVRTEGVLDGAKADLSVKVKEGAEVEAVKGLAVKGSKIDHKYSIKWKDKHIAAGKYEFIVEATLAEHTLTAKSGVLAVDLVPPVCSA